MEEQFASIEYVQFAPDILVPLSWPIYDIESFALKAIRRIIETSQQESPVVEINKVFARLIRNHPSGFPFVFELVPKEQVIENDIYQIVSHTDENNNEIKIISRSDPGSLETCWTKIREPMCILRPRLIKNHKRFLDAANQFLPQVVPEPPDMQNF